MAGKPGDWLTLGLLGFLGGIVANIIVPVRRGALGFVGAACIGVFCGGVSGMASAEWGAGLGWQYVIAAVVGVLGDRILSAILSFRLQHTTNVNIHGGENQNSFGDSGNFHQGPNHERRNEQDL